MKTLLLAVVAAAVLMPSLAQGGLIANWTFESSVPTTGGPHVAEAGLFAAGSNASSNSGGTFSNPAGNGSAESFSSNGWNAGEYYQFTTNTVGYENVMISFAQAASSTGPGDFEFQYSTDGTNYVNFGGQYDGPTSDFNGSTFNPLNVLSFDLSSITGLNNQANVGFRIAVVGTTSENGGTIASTGTFRVDDFSVTATAVPEPTAILMVGMAIAGCVVRRRRIG